MIKGDLGGGAVGGVGEWGAWGLLRGCAVMVHGDMHITSGTDTCDQRRGRLSLIPGRCMTAARLGHDAGSNAEGDAAAL